MALPEYTAYSTEGKRKLPPNLNPMRPIAALTGISLKPAEAAWSTGPAPAILGAQPPALVPTVAQPTAPATSPAPDYGGQLAGPAGVGTAPPKATPTGDYIDRGFGQPQEVALSKYAIGGPTEGAAAYDPVAQLARLQAIDPEKYGGSSTEAFAGVAPVRPNVGKMGLGEAAAAKGQFAADQAAYLQGRELAGQRRGQDIQAQGQRLQYGVGMAGVGERRYATDVGAETSEKARQAQLYGHELGYAGTIAGHAQRQQEAEARAAQEAAKAATDWRKFELTTQEGPPELRYNPILGGMEYGPTRVRPQGAGLVPVGGQAQGAAPTREDALAAIARGASKADVNKRLAAAGLPPV